MRLRRPAAGDAARLAELSGALGYPVPAEAMATRLADIAARTDHLVLVAEAENGELTGWIHAARRDALESEPRCEIVGLVVDAGHRRAGIGQALVGAAEEWARERGLGEMTVRSNVTRAESHPFYEGIGYTRVKTSHIYRKPTGGSPD